MNTASLAISDVVRRRRESGQAWFEFVRESSLSMGVYHIPTGTSDRDTHAPHDRDEVYIGVSGRGRLTADSVDYFVDADAIIFVKAGVEHYFHDVTEDLTVLVFFAGRAEA